MSINTVTATFLFTDLENSTPLWDKHPELMQALSAQHDDLLRQAIADHHGRIVKGTGDGFHAVFDMADDAVAAALSGQQAMLAQAWPGETGPLKVRMGIHTGASQEREGDYYGPEVNRAARVMGAAHGGQILLSAAASALLNTARLADLSLLDLGEHRLRGLSAVETLFQLCHPELPGDFPALKTLSVYQHNLPAQLTSFVGRQQEMAEVHRLLRGTRMLTLLGPGGTGKTRLMLECAEEAAGEYADGVWLVELASLADGTLIDERVAAALDVQEQPGRAIRETLVDYLRRKELLLLLDNVEHLVRPGAELAHHLLTRCPNLNILATSREALFIPGEITLQIPALSLPDSGQVDLEAIRASEGCRLFLARAQEVRPDFQLLPENGAAVVGIVRHLDGIPLALELAAARLRTLSVNQIAERLHDRFRLLTSGRRTALPHQQTLHALIEWSWKLLDEKEQLLLRRLAAFSNGWTLEAAEAVAGSGQLDPFEILDLLEQLVNKSLVTVSYPPSGDARYGMLESIHQFSRDRLAESGEADSLHDRHTDYFVSFAEEAGRHLVYASTRTWVHRVVADLDNLRAVLKRTLPRRPDLALRITGSLFYGELPSVTAREAQSWLEPAVESARASMAQEGSPCRPVDYIRSLIGLGIAVAVRGELAQARTLLDENTQLAWEIDEPRYAAIGVAGRYMTNPFTLSDEHRQEMESAAVACRQRQHHFELLNLLLVYALALEADGSTEQAKALFQEAAALSRAGKVRYDGIIFIGVQFQVSRLLGDFQEEKRYIADGLRKLQAVKHRRGTVVGQSALAHLLRRHGHLDEAQQYYEKSITGWLEIGHKTAVAHQLECLAYIAIAREETDRAAALLGAAGSIRRQQNTPSGDPQEIAELAQAMDQLSAALGPASRDAALAQGRLLTLDDAVQLALESRQR